MVEGHEGHHADAVVVAATGAGGGADDAKRSSSSSPVTRAAELELALDSAARVNRHLNGEIEAVLVSLKAAEAERQAWEDRARWLAQKLADERRRRRTGEGGGAAATANDDQDQAASSLLMREAAEAQQQQQQQQQMTMTMTDPEKQQQQQQQQQQLAWQAWQACAPERASLALAGRAAGWLARRGEIELGARLGEGAFGVTYRCVWRGADAVAKHLRPPSTAAEARNFLREVGCLAAVRHPHVVPFLGAVLGEGPTELWLLSEYMPGGSMADWLRGRAPASAASADTAARPFTRPPPLAERLAAALDVARALAALSAATPYPLMHRDVKPSNVFIDAGGRARLGDFGLARFSGVVGGGEGAEDEGPAIAGGGGGGGAYPSPAADLTGETGTYAYMAPEVVRHEAYDGSKADAWSFGVLLVEAAALERPYEHCHMTPVQIALGVADEKLRPWIPATMLPPGVSVLAGALCDFDPGMRPDWPFVLAELEVAVAELRAAARERAARERQWRASSSLLSRILGAEMIPDSWLPVLASASASAPAVEGEGRGGGGAAGAGTGGNGWPAS
jgi:serine/threonine protein kinase